MLLTPADVSLIPQYGIVTSRSKVKLETTFLGRKMYLPIFAANMDTVSGYEMCFAMDNQLAAAILHRNMTIGDQVDIVRTLKKDNIYVYAAVGACWEDWTRIGCLINTGVDCISIDIAHGYSIMVKDTLKFIRRTYHDSINVIVGNVATKQGTKDLFKWGADAVKVGIGPGSACSTRRQTGYGVPQFSAVLEAVKGAKGKPIIADGGISSPGDAAKLIGAGAHAVMIGSLFAGTTEAPGAEAVVDGKRVKVFRGMASTEAGSKYSEGVSGHVPLKGSVVDVLKDFENGLRSAISYAGYDDINDFRGNAKWQQQTINGIIEGNPRI